MLALEVPEAEARRIAEAAADWIDSDTEPGPVGGRGRGLCRPATRPTGPATPCSPIPASCARVAGVTPALYRRLRPWLCALPTSDLSPININTLRPEQAPLLAMLAPGQLSLERRAAGARRRGPSTGWGNQIEFWRIEALSGLERAARRPAPAAAEDGLVHARRRGRASATRASTSTVLVDARLQPSRVVARAADRMSPGRQAT